MMATERAQERFLEAIASDKKLFFEAIASDKKLSRRNKIFWLLTSCRNLWAIADAADRVRRCYDNIETRHETMPAAMHDLDLTLRMFKEGE